MSKLPLPMEEERRKIESEISEKSDQYLRYFYRHCFFKQESVHVGDTLRLVVNTGSITPQIVDHMTANSNNLLLCIHTQEKQADFIECEILEQFAGILPKRTS